MCKYCFCIHYYASAPHRVEALSDSDINKDWTCKDKDKDQTYQDKDKDLTHKDKDLNLVLKDKD